MNFNDKLKHARAMTKREVSRISGIDEKSEYKHVVFAEGSFYHDGAMYNTKDGSLVKDGGCHNNQMIKMGKMIHELH